MYFTEIEENSFCFIKKTEVCPQTPICAINKMNIAQIGCCCGRFSFYHSRNKCNEILDMGKMFFKFIVRKCIMPNISLTTHLKPLTPGFNG